MKDSERDTLKEVGVDYITATFVGRHGDSSLAAFGSWLVREQEQSGEKSREFRFSGYRGMTAGGASYGRRHDGELVRCSSEVAREHWNQIYTLATNITRLDIQVTAFPAVGPSRRLANHHRQLRRRKRQRGRPPRYKFWIGPDGPEAATLGQRTSDVFGRIYDKGLESKLPEYRGALRYEFELKRAIAVNTAMHLDQSEDPDSQIIRMVQEFAHVRACRFSSWYNELEANGRVTGLPPSGLRQRTGKGSDWCQSVPTSPIMMLGSGAARRRAMWLSNSVRPCVQEFLARGQHDVVLEALGLSVGDGTIVREQDARWSNFNKWR